MFNEDSTSIIGEFIIDERWTKNMETVKSNEAFKNIFLKNEPQYFCLPPQKRAASEENINIQTCDMRITLKSGFKKHARFFSLFMHPIWSKVNMMRVILLFN